MSVGVVLTWYTRWQSAIWLHGWLLAALVAEGLYYIVRFHFISVYHIFVPFLSSQADDTEEN